MTRRRTQEGSATLLVVAMAAVLLLLGSALGVVTAMVAAHRVAQSAADLAALAGARGLATGREGCAAATQVAVANGARVTDVCRLRARRRRRGGGRRTPLAGPDRRPDGPVARRAGAVTISARAPRRITTVVPRPPVGRLLPGCVVEQDVEERDGPRLVERVVLVAALG